MLIDPNDVDTCSSPTRKVVEVVMCSCSTAEFMAVVVDPMIIHVDQLFPVADSGSHPQSVIDARSYGPGGASERFCGRGSPRSDGLLSLPAEVPT